MFLLIAIVALIVLGLIEMVLVEAERFWWATILMILTGVGLHFFHVFDLLTWVKVNGWFCLVYVGAYFLAGVVWSFVKWFSYLMRMRDRYRQYREEYLQSQKLPNNTTITDDLMKEIRHFIHDKWDREFHPNDVGARPKARQNKGRITAWVAYWPISAIGTLINDPIRRLLDLIWASFKGLYQSVVERVYREHPELK